MIMSDNRSIYRALSHRQCDPEIAEAYKLVSQCTPDDLCALFDTTAFNPILYAFCQGAMERAGLDKATRLKVLHNLKAVLDVYPANKAVARFNID